MHGPQRYFQSQLKSFGRCRCNRPRSGSGEHISNEFDGLPHHIGEAHGETRMFQGPDRSSQRCQIFWCYARQVQSHRATPRFSIRMPAESFANASLAPLAVTTSHGSTHRPPQLIPESSVPARGRTSIAIRPFAVAKNKAAKAVPCRLVLPLPTGRNLVDGQRFHRGKRQAQRVWPGVAHTFLPICKATDCDHSGY